MDWISDSLTRQNQLSIFLNLSVILISGKSRNLVEGESDVYDINKFCLNLSTIVPFRQ